MIKIGELLAASIFSMRSRNYIGLNTIGSGDDVNKLENDNSAQVISSPANHRWRVFSKITIPKILIVMVLLVTAFALALAYGMQEFHSSSVRKDCFCGKTVEEAITMNCAFDAYAAAWLPYECIDQELSDLFDHSGPGENGEWPYFLDKLGNMPINKSEVAMHGGSALGYIHTTHEWHIVHCHFYWQKQVRAKDTGVIVEARYDTLSHARHCEKVALMRNELDEIDTMFPIVLNSAEQNSQQAPIIRALESEMENMEYARASEPR